MDVWFAYHWAISGIKGGCGDRTRPVRPYSYDSWERSLSIGAKDDDACFDKLRSVAATCGFGALRGTDVVFSGAPGMNTAKFYAARGI